MGGSILIHQVLLLKMCLWQRRGKKKNKSPQKELRLQQVGVACSWCSELVSALPHLQSASPLLASSQPGLAGAVPVSVRQGERHAERLHGAGDGFQQPPPITRLLCETTCSLLNCSLPLFLGVIQTMRGSWFCSFMRRCLRSSLPPCSVAFHQEELWV